MVSRAALDAGASSLAVYTVEEGLALRQAGIECRILVFGHFLTIEAPSICEANLTPTVSSEAAGKALQDAATGDIPYHVKIDTGLGRAGVAPTEAVPLMRSLAHFPALRPEGIYTHFARADEEPNGATADQLCIFRQAIELLERDGHVFPVKHAASTAAITLPGTHFNAVRVGIGLYGYHASHNAREAIRLRPALRLVSTLTRVHQLEPGRGVGYGHDFVAQRESRIGLVPIGYGDGIRRSLGNGRGTVIVGGHLVPIVGRVSMDQLTIDLTEVPEAQEDDEVTLIGRDHDVEQTADDLASQSDTISYEVLTCLLPRVPRLYFRRGELVGRMQFASGPAAISRQTPD